MSNVSEMNDGDSGNKVKKPQYEEYFMSNNIFITNGIIALASILFLIKNYNNFILVLFLIISNLVFYYITKINHNNYKLFLSKKNVYIRNNSTKNKVTLNLIDDIAFVKVSRTMVGRIFNYGDIELLTKDNVIYKIPSIRSPNQFRDNLISNTRRYYKHLGINYDELMKTYKLIEEWDEKEANKDKEKQIEENIKNKNL